MFQAFDFIELKLAAISSAQASAGQPKFIRRARQHCA
jgi:hypothetical protein